MNDLRIGSVIQRFHPIVGGMERQCRSISGRLVSQGWDVTVFTYRPDPDTPRQTVVDGIKVRRFGRGTWTRWDLYHGYWARLTALYRDRHTYDLIQVYGAGHSAVLGLTAGWLTGKPVLVRPATLTDVSRYLHGDRSVERSVLGRIYQFDPLRLKRRLFGRAVAWIALTPPLREELLDLGFPAERIHVIPNGVDENKYRPANEATRQPLREKYGLPASATIFLFVGRFVRRKGLFDLLAAWERLLEHKNNSCLVMVGSGKNQRDSTERELVERANSLQDIYFAGMVEEPVDYFRMANVFVLPSHREGLPNALLEGMACGLAPIVTNIDGVRDVVTSGRDGLVVEPRQPAELAQAMEHLLNQVDRRRAFGSAARRTIVARYSLGQTVKEYGRLYRSSFSERS